MYTTRFKTLCCNHRSEYSHIKCCPICGESIGMTPEIGQWTVNKLDL